MIIKNQCRYCGATESRKWLTILDGKPPICENCRFANVYTRHELEQHITAAEVSTALKYETHSQLKYGDGTGEDPVKIAEQRAVEAFVSELARTIYYQGANILDGKVMSDWEKGYDDALKMVLKFIGKPLESPSEK